MSAANDLRLLKRFMTFGKAYNALHRARNDLTLSRDDAMIGPASVRQKHRAACIRGRWYWLHTAVATASTA